MGGACWKEGGLGLVLECLGSYCVLGLLGMSTLDGFVEADGGILRM